MKTRTHLRRFGSFRIPMYIFKYYAQYARAAVRFLRRRFFFSFTIRVSPSWFFTIVSARLSPGRFTASFRAGFSPQKTPRVSTREKRKSFMLADLITHRYMYIGHITCKYIVRGADRIGLRYNNTYIQCT